MTGTKRDYTQYLQSTRKVNISDLIAQQAQHNAPRAHADEYRSSQPTTSRYRPYHQEVAGYQPPAPTRAAYGFALCRDERAPSAPRFLCDHSR